MPYDGDSELQLAEVHERLEVSIKTELTTIMQCYLVMNDTCINTQLYKKMMHWVSSYS